MTPAPIFISVYDRVEHFKSCLTSLLANEEAKYSTLYVSSDGARDSASAKSVSSVREVIREIRGFHRVVSFCPSENTAGRIKLLARREMASQHSSFIITEDDNVFSSYALRFLNEGLVLFEDDPDVVSISAYMYPHFPARSNSQIYLRCFAGWGFGLWRDKDIGIDTFDFDQRALAAKMIRDRSLLLNMNRCLPHVAPMLASIAEGHLKAEDAIRCGDMTKKLKLSVFPAMSLVRNIGFDGSGEHCGVDDLFARQEIASEPLGIDLSIPRLMLSEDEAWLCSFFGGSRRLWRSLAAVYRVRWPLFRLAYDGAMTIRAFIRR